MKKTVLIIILLSLVITNLASANPGVYQINQACLAVGCFAGDNPNTDTIEIKNSGTYILTSNISVDNITALSVQPLLGNKTFTIDLNGFQIEQTAITPNNTVYGINITGPNTLVSMKNGHIKNFRDGIHANNRDTVIRVDNIVFDINDDDAIQAANGIISNSIFKNNVYGINALGSSGVVLPGDRLYIQGNQFISFDGSQDAIFSGANTNYCKDNMIAYSGENLGSCTLSGLNLCGNIACTVILKSTERSIKE